MVAIIETAASTEGSELSPRPRTVSLDIGRASSGKSRSKSGRLLRSRSGASASSPVKAAAKVDFGKIVEKEERSTGGVELRMYKVSLAISLSFPQACKRLCLQVAVPTIPFLSLGPIVEQASEGF